METFVLNSNQKPKLIIPWIFVGMASLWLQGCGSTENKSDDTTQISTALAISTLNDTVNQVGALAGHDTNLLLARKNPGTMDLQSPFSLTDSWGSDWSSAASSAAYFTSFQYGAVALIPSMPSSFTATCWTPHSRATTTATVSRPIFLVA